MVTLFRAAYALDVAAPAFLSLAVIGFLGLVYVVPHSLSSRSSRSPQWSAFVQREQSNHPMVQSHCYTRTRGTSRIRSRSCSIGRPQQRKRSKYRKDLTRSGGYNIRCVMGYPFRRASRLLLVSLPPSARTQTGAQGVPHLSIDIDIDVVHPKSCSEGSHWRFYSLARVLRTAFSTHGQPMTSSGFDLHQILLSNGSILQPVTGFHG